MSELGIAALWKQALSTIIVVVISIILFGFYRAFTTKRTEQLQEQLRQQEKLNAELKKQLEAPATGKIIYVEKPVHIIKYVPYYITQSVLPPTPVTIAIDDLCRIADQNRIMIKTAIENKYVYCETDFCDPSDSVIRLKAEAFTTISNIEQHKQGIWHISGVAGYDAIHNNFTLGVSFLDWYDMIAGVNAGFNFKRLSDT
ncbi:MAG: hypothetical protein ACP5JP_02225, partial [bacterium]